MKYIFINPVVDKMYIKENLDKLVEMLYCDNGCNNGDGVLISE